MSTFSRTCFGQKQPNVCGGLGESRGEGEGEGGEGEQTWARKTVTEKLAERPVSEPAKGGWLGPVAGHPQGLPEDDSFFGTHSLIHQAGPTIFLLAPRLRIWRNHSIQCCLHLR